jgi:hypothetical protein
LRAGESAVLYGGAWRARHTLTADSQSRAVLNRSDTPSPSTPYPRQPVPAR